MCRRSCLSSFSRRLDFILFTCRKNFESCNSRFATKAALEITQRMRKRSAIFFFLCYFSLYISMTNFHLNWKLYISSVTTARDSLADSCKIACCCNRTKWQWNRKALASYWIFFCYATNRNSSRARDFSSEIDKLYYFWIFTSLEN